MLIYAIRNTLDGKVYIGKTTKLLCERWNQHKKALISNKHTNSHLQSAWNLYGEQSFVIEQLETCSSMEMLNEAERHHISAANSANRQFGYNMSFGGDGGRLSDEVYEKQSTKMTGRTLSNEHKDNIRKSLIGRKVTWGDKISAKNKGVKPSVLAIQRSKQLFTGIPLSDSTKHKISTSVKAAYKNMPVEKIIAKNKKISDAQVGRIAGGIDAYNKANTAKKEKKESRVPQLELLNSIKQGLTIGEIATIFNVGTATISRMCYHYWNKSIKQIKKDISDADSRTN